MDKIEENRNNENKEKQGAVHFLLAHAYLLFFVAIILGVIFDFLIKLNLLETIAYSKSGIVFVFFGTGLVYWAQSSSAKAGKIKPEERSSDGFALGPYKFFRNPTYLGLFIMTLGFGLLINSVFSIFFVLIAHLVIRFIFVKKEEKILEEKYGDIYVEYKRKVKDVI